MTVEIIMVQCNTLSETCDHAQGLQRSCQCIERASRGFGAGLLAVLTSLKALNRSRLFLPNIAPVQSCQIIVMGVV